MPELLAGSQDSGTNLLAFAFIALAVLSAALLVRARIQSRGSRAVERTLNTIGRSFFAIYRVDWRQGRYRTVKSAPDVDTALGDRGSYEHLLAVLSEHVHADTLEDFRRNLSLDNIKRSVQGGATETGGRYQREFPDGAHWVSVRVIFDPDMSGQEVIMCFSVIDGRMHEEIRRQELLQNALEAAQQASRHKSIFFSNI